MIDPQKAIEGILSTPGHKLVALIIFSSISFFLFHSQPLHSWPSAWPSQEVIGAIFGLVALLCTSLLFTQAVRFFGEREIARRKNLALLRRRRELLETFAPETKAILQRLAAKGFGWFYGEPGAVYVQELRRAALVTVDSAEDGWGQYTLTTEGDEIVHKGYPFFFAILDAHGADWEKLRLSLRGASLRASGKDLEL